MGYIKPFNAKTLFFKWFIDIFGSLTLLIMAIPLGFWTAYKIHKQSPGKLFFKQPRVGVKGSIFNAYKFRSMHENSHFNPYTQKDDSRIFPYGKLMRKTRIDELPQILNILKGEMHLIGPRAEWNILSDQYITEIPYYDLRNLIKPGITGWAQVNYPYGANSEDARQKLMYDLYYIKNWSFALEIETAWKTIGVVLGKKGL